MRVVILYGYIYKITNLLTNKSYIGKHKHPVATLDENYITSGVLIQKLIDKYGIVNFSREIIDTADTLEELNRKEIFYISKFSTYYPDGYNLTSGGDGAPNLTPESKEKLAYWKGKTQSEETKKKRRESLRKVVHTKEWVDKIREANKGTPPSELSKKRSSEVNTGRRWYTNGVTEILTKEDPPEGFIPGKLPRTFKPLGPAPRERVEKVAAQLRGRKWYNNGIEERMLKDCDIPEGFVRGRLKL